MASHSWNGLAVAGKRNGRAVCLGSRKLGKEREEAYGGKNESKIRDAFELPRAR